jgi:hypothetical protein
MCESSNRKLLNLMGLEVARVGLFRFTDSTELVENLGTHKTQNLLKWAADYTRITRGHFENRENDRRDTREDVHGIMAHWNDKRDARWAKMMLGVQRESNARRKAGRLSVRDDGRHQLLGWFRRIHKGEA